MKQSGLFRRANGLFFVFLLMLAGCGGDNDSPQPLLGEKTIPLYKDGSVDALKNWPPPQDTRMGDSNTPRDVRIKGADNVVTPDGSTIPNDTWSPRCPDVAAPFNWPHPGNKRHITIKNSCLFPVWIGLQSSTPLPLFCSVKKTSCTKNDDCGAVAQTCSGGVCSEDTKSCSDNKDCAAATQVCVKNAYGDGFPVASGQTRVYELPNVWISGTLWGRTNCRNCTADQATGTRCCETGDASGTLFNRHEDGSAIGMEKPVTKIELNFGSSPDYYDIS